MHNPFPRFWTWLGIGLASLSVGAFLILTPASPLRKIDYIAAAVCHRIPSHSYFILGHQLPLCQRCTGTFPGALTGLLFQWVILKRRKARRFPPMSVFGILALFLLAWGLDGFNSYTTLLTGRPEGLLGYAPQPWLRLLTGSLVGMGMSMMLIPAFNQVLWRDVEDRRVIRGWKEFGILIAVELLQVALIHRQADWLFYPLTLYSGAAILTMFTCLGAMVFVMALGYDNLCAGWREAWVPLLWGVTFAFTLVGGVDLFRYYFTGTMDSMPGLE